MVDSAALDAFAQSVTGSEGVLATTARTLLDALGLAEKATVPADADDEASRTRAALAALDAELRTTQAEIDDLELRWLELSEALE